MELKLTFVGILTLLLTICYLIKYKFSIPRIFTSTEFFILYGYFSFFGTYKNLNVTFNDNCLLLFSFLLFWSTYKLWGKKGNKTFNKFLNRFIKRKHSSSEWLASKKASYIFIYVCIGYVILDLWINTFLYGSLMKALVRFYTGVIENDNYTILKNFLTFLYPLTTIFVFIIRYYQDIYNKKHSIFLVGVILLILIAIPRGSRGAIISPILSLISADIFACRFHKYKIKKNLTQYSIFGLLSVFLIISISIIRNKSFENIEEAYDAISQIEFNSSDETIEGESEIVLRDAIKSFHSFGANVNFLPIYYTFSSFVVSPIPRVLIPNKPISFGFILNGVKNGNYIFTHDSLVYPGAIDWGAGLAGEGWANGGIWGVILYSLLFGYFSGICSNAYKKMFYSRSLLGPFFGLQLFRMSSGCIRGSLLSTTNTMILTFILSLIIIKCIMKK